MTIKLYFAGIFETRVSRVNYGTVSSESITVINRSEENSYEAALFPENESKSCATGGVSLCKLLALILKFRYLRENVESNDIYFVLSYFLINININKNILLH